MVETKYAILFSEKLTKGACMCGNVISGLQPPLLTMENFCDVCS